MPRRSTASASELELYRFFRTAGHTPERERAVRRFSKLGEHGLLWQGIALCGAAVDADERRRWLRAWATIVLAFGANQVVKLLFRRPRPDVPGLPRLMGTMSNRSYPSAHATTAATAAWVLPPLVAGRGSGARSPLRGAAASAIAPVGLAMSLSRLYLGVHWPSDVLAGYALGAAIGELAS